MTGNCGKKEGLREQILDEKSNIKGVQKDK